LRRAIARGCARAFPHPTISKINPKKRTDAQKAELRAWRKEHQWHPNQIRHTVGTEVRSKHGLEAAQVFLGHSRADVTQTYAERDLAKAADVARKIG
jgi:site-specific recombinase XerC